MLTMELDTDLNGDVSELEFVEKVSKRERASRFFLLFLAGGGFFWAPDFFWALSGRQKPVLLG